MTPGELRSFECVAMSLFAEFRFIIEQICSYPIWFVDYLIGYELPVFSALDTHHGATPIDCLLFYARDLRNDCHRLTILCVAAAS